MIQRKFYHKNFANILTIDEYKLEDDTKTKSITFRLEIGLFKQIKEKSNNNISDFIREAIKNKLGT